MPYPKKLTREAVLQAAIAHVEREGVAALSMRALAAELGVAPNALYRHVGSKAELEFAIADEAGRVLLQAVEGALQGAAAIEAIPVLARAYLDFARSYPAVYGVMMRYCHDEGGQPPSHARLWEQVCALIESLHTGVEAEALAKSWWAFLHGLVELDRANLLDGRPMEDILAVGMQVFVAGLRG